MPLRLPIVSKFDPSGIRDAQTGLDRLGGFARNAGTLLAGAFVAGGIAAGAFAVSSLRAADESFKVGKALDQAAKNAGVFGNTDKDIQKATGALKDHAQKLGELIGVDDEVLLSIEKTWMAVPSLAGLGTKGIEHLAEVAANVAAGTGKDVETIGLAFIKIAGDSETAMSKLTRQGVVFTDAQKETYQALLDNGQEVEAQAYLIDQLDAKYAGMAEAAASPLARIQQMFTNFQEVIGTALMPALEKLAPLIGAALAKMVADPTFQKFLVDLGKAFVDILPSITQLLPSLMSLIKEILPGIIAIAPGVSNLIRGIADMFKRGSADGKGFKDMMQLISGVLSFVGDAVRNVNNYFADQNKLLLDGQVSIFTFLTPLGFLQTLIHKVGAEVRNLIENWNELFGITSSKPLSRVSMSVGSGGLKLASGGIVTPRPGGTMATIGEGGQAEAVIPLDKLGTIMGGTGGGTTYNVVVNGGLSTSADIGRAVVDAIKKYERVSGPVFVGA
jgi:cation transport regulator ChaC